ncbi:pyridoxal phosphate-dependent aminotransferase [Sanguibacter sp. A247]|uniref:pyridoxal phosphate-dependent aminotransferase n=1 Tax=unclassified Sanguibacter TaxID=2645534 RepID=UPI003FD7E488
MKVSQRASVPPFAVMQIIAAANARRAAGQDIINLCAGEPATGASDAVRDRAREFLDGRSLGYTEALGAPALREALAQHYGRWYGIDVDPARIAVTTGSSGGFMLAFLAAFDVGDRVALVRPGYPAYRNILATLGCEVVELAAGADVGYAPTPAMLDVAHAEAPLTGLVLASPANPTGTMIDPARLAALAGWCADHDVRLVSDEIYHGIVSDPARWPGATAAEHLASGAVVVSSFSKYWAMTGWRLGWLVLPDDLLAPVDALAGNVALCPPALAQHAAVAALEPAGYAAAARDAEQYARSREVLLGRLDEAGWSEVAPADGAFYVYASIAGSGLSSPEWCARLLDEAGVALTPGTDFDPVDGHRWVRVSCAQDPATIAEAVDRIAAWRATL